MIKNTFRSESALVENFMKHARSKFLKEILCAKGTKSFLLREFDSLYGIADIVMGTIKKNSRRSSIDPNWAMPLTKFQIGQIFSIDDLQKLYGFTTKTLKEKVVQYERAGFVRRESRNQFRLEKSYELSVDNVVSIEAKLSDWRRALIQACRYKKFSNYAFVLLDEGRSATALKNISVFERENIGLLTLREKKVTIHFFPVRNELRKNNYSTRLNETVYEVCFRPVSYFAAP